MVSFPVAAESGVMLRKCHFGSSRLHLGGLDAYLVGPTVEQR